MRKLLFYSFGFLLCMGFVSCGENKKSATDNGQTPDSVMVEAEEEVVPLAPLQTGEVFLKDKDPFSEVIELAGTHIVEPDTFIFKAHEDKMLVCADTLLVQKNLHAPFNIFNYPALTYVKTIGLHGNGPDEFIYPEIVPSVDKNVLCYLYERTNGKVYRLDHKLNISYLYTLFSSKRGGWDVDDLHNVAEGEFVYALGRNIFNIKVEKGDSVKKQKIYNLTLPFARKSPTTGSLAVNVDKDRMVYAYKYFKVVKFMDMRGDSVRTLNFQQKGFEDETMRLADGWDLNVTHYMQVCPTKDYVYISYSGRTPYVVGNENAKGKRYMHVEQYDWNGNPVRKYKLDNFSISMMADGRLDKLLLVTYYNDDPFYMYDLQD